MLAGLKNLRKEFAEKGRPKPVDTDNRVFKLHYILLFWGLSFAALLVYANDYIGQKIECTHGDHFDNTKDRLEHIMNQYCLYFSLFTVPAHYNNSFAASPGVGPYVEYAGTEIDRLSWYPWVPYILFIQACFFYFPRLVWRLLEGRRMRRFCESIALFASFSETQRAEIEQQACKELPGHLSVNTDWPMKLMFCEILNTINIFVQMNFTDWFLNGHFWNLGYEYYAHYNDQKFRTLDSFFPKVAKCTFPRIGHTGTIQYQDLICVLSYNVMNEKIYLILWHVYIVVAAITVMWLVHRLLSAVLYSSRLQYNAQGLIAEMPKKPDMRDVFFLMERFSYLEWFFLQSLIKNLNPDTASKLLTGTAKAYNNDAVDRKSKSKSYSLI